MKDYKQNKDSVNDSQNASGNLHAGNSNQVNQGADIQDAAMQGFEAPDAEMPDAIIEAYLKQLDAETPDLWDRIEKGLDKQEQLRSASPENGNGQLHSVDLKNSSKRSYSAAQKKGRVLTLPRVLCGLSIAAVIIAAIIVTPLMWEKKSMKSEDNVTGYAENDEESNDMAASDLEERWENTQQEEDAANKVMEGAKGECVVENGDTPDVEDESTRGQSEGTDSTIAGTTNDTMIKFKAKVIYVADSISIEIISVDENEFHIKEGDICSVIIENEKTDAQTLLEDEELTGFIIGMENESLVIRIDQ